MRYINRGFGRFFVFPVSNHHIIDGGMVEFIGQNYDVWDNIDFLLKNFDQDTIPGFNGIVARYDIYRTPTSGIVYRNGQKAKNVRTEIVRVRGKDMERLASTPVLDSLPVQDGQ
ncbi:hypothetical protein GCM10023143_08220 [Compostibacter hankyongensis]|uniref:Uncharacterized protein n=2 Tax=Compostibacter hankyongensis TaxID=1007089 RepID=A0ABP8FHX9_9BACT